MKKYILVFVSLLLLNSSFLLSKEVNEETAKKVAISFLHDQKANINSMIITHPIAIQEKNISTCYIFKFENGFIIISADNSVFPILGYSFESTYKENDIIPAFSFWLKQLSRQIFKNIEMQAVAPANIAATWENYMSDNFVSSQTKSAVTPLINTAWNQDLYYNSAFPEDAGFSSNHPYTGCVATVMGQIMKYYNWPKTGTGQNTIDSPYGELTANFGNTTYDWAGMETYLDSENPAVAELLYHNAIAVNSEFYPEGTGAYDFNIPPALTDFFKYKETAEFLWTNNYTSENWKTMIKDELNQGRPLIYGGIDIQDSVGHTFICDGYQDESFFHFNWGWGGQHNGYYYLDSLIVGGYHFDYQHDVVIGIKPDISGIMEVYPPENLSSEVEMRDVILTWQVPTITGTLELLGYNVYRNDSLLNQSILTLTTFTDFDSPPGNHTYKVNTSYIGDGNGRSTEIETFVSDVNEKINSPVSVFPNPTNGKSWISSKQPFQNSSVSVCNLSGMEIKKVPLLNALTEQTLELSELDKGVYILRFKIDGQIFTEKLIMN